MVDKFAQYYSTEERIEELSEYVHLNFKVICTKMISEMRRELDITPDQENKDGYLSLQASIFGRMFNEMVYSMCGVCQCLRMKITEIVPALTLMIIFDLIEGKNPLKGAMRSDVKHDLKKFQKYYDENIDNLRSIVEALPKFKK